MKKLNNRGFAISTVLYTLLLMAFLIVILMMSIMASSRNNSKNFIKNIEDDLNRFSLTETIFLPTGTNSAEEQMFFVPEGKSGWYKIELWGAAGGNTTKKGGKGAYTSGLVYLNSNDRIYFYIGTKGSSSIGGANGGGHGNGTGAGGGGATDVRILPGAWNDIASLSTRIMVAAGGSGATKNNKGETGNALFGYDKSDEGIGKPGNQISGGIGENISNSGKLGEGGNGITNGSGGGSGYFGGSGGKNNAGGGGSSYISGFSSTPHKSLKFYDGKMLDNTNEGNGKAKISLISENSKDKFPLTSINNDLNNVRYIKDCVEKTGLNDSEDPEWERIEAITDTFNVVNINKITDSTEGRKKCKIVDLTREYDLDEIAVWHFDDEELNIKKRILINHTLEVAGSNGIYRKIIDNPEGNLSMPEGIMGTRINTRWSHKFGKDNILPDGTYYISSALNPNNAFLTANNNTTVDKNSDGKIDSYDNMERDLYLDVMNGTDLQKWVFIRKEFNGKSYYEIHEKETFQPLCLLNKFGEENTNVVTKVVDDINSSLIKWEVIPQGDGTYRISSLYQPFDFGKDYYTTLSTYMNSYGGNGGTIILRRRNQVNNTVNRFYITNAYK